MLRKTVLLFAVLTATGCGTQAPAATTPVHPPPTATPPPPPRQVNPHIRVTMPQGWTPVDLSNVARGSFATSINDDLGARILITQGRIVGPAREEAVALSEMLRHDGFVCAKPVTSADGTVAAFTVSRAGMRGKIAVRHFGDKTARIVVLGQWPKDADAEGRQAVDAVIASAEYR